MPGRIPNERVGLGQSGARRRPVACAGWRPTVRSSRQPVGRSSTTGSPSAPLDWGGDGPPLVLLHPNGFCAGVFDPLARLLRDEYRPIGIDLRGHGTSDAPATYEDCGFVAAAGDVVAVLDALGLDEVVLLGESLGGGTGILVDRLRPGLVRRLLLCEAIAMRPVGGLPGAERENHMSAMARRRRAVWADRATVGSRTAAGRRST